MYLRRCDQLRLPLAILPEVVVAMTDKIGTSGTAPQATMAEAERLCWRERRRQKARAAKANADSTVSPASRASADSKVSIHSTAPAVPAQSAPPEPAELSREQVAIDDNIARVRALDPKDCPACQSSRWGNCWIHEVARAPRDCHGTICGESPCQCDAWGFEWS